MGGKRWTEDRLKAEVLKHGSRAELKRNNQSAYVTARKSFPHLLDLLEYQRQELWSDPKNILDAASRCVSLAQFRSEYPGAYGAVRRKFPTLLVGVFQTKRQSWDEGAITEAATGCATRFEFGKKFPGALSAADSRFPGLLRALFDNHRKAWDAAAVREVASQYTTRVEFFRDCPGGYKAAHRLGLIDDLGFQDQPGCDNDAIYIWRAVGQHFSGNPVYKIGVTSARLGTRRVEDVAKGVGFEYDLICCERVACKATDLERKLHILGENPGYSGFDGATEFRALSDSALYAAVSMICNQVTE